MGNKSSATQRSRVTCAAGFNPGSRFPLKSRNAYRYLPLPHDKRDAIRLVVIAPGDYDDRMEVDIIQTMTSNPSVEYEALSYAWDIGPDIAWESIHTEDKHIAVTSGLMQAMRAIRSPKKKTFLWVDQVCINQQDERERSTQMTIMRYIYGRAKRTIVWLGDSGPDDKTTIHLIRACTVFRINLREQAEILLETKFPEFTDFTTAFVSCMTIFKDDSYVPKQLRTISRESIEKILVFFSRRWFQRLWCFSEVVHSAHQVVIRCGSEEFHWTDLGLFAYWLSKSTLVHLPGPQIPNGLNAITQMYAHWLNAGMALPLIHLLHASRKFESSDSRDKVFAILGMSQEIQAVGNNIPRHLTIDNSLSMKEVYTQIARYILHRNQDLALLSLVQHTRPQIDNNKLPSWVPDWTQPEMTCPIWLTEVEKDNLFSAGPPLSLPFKLTSSTKLTLRGFKIAKVVEEAIVSSIVDKDLHAIELGRRDAGLKILQWVVRMHTSLTHKLSAISDAWCVEALTLTTGRSEAGVLVTGTNETATPSGTDVLTAHVRAFCAFVSTLSPDFFCIPEQARKVVAEMQSQMRAYAGGETCGGVKHAIFSACRNRTLFSVGGTDWWLGPLHTSAGDIVCILEGGRVPLMLRPRKPGRGYYLVGECYNVHTMYDRGWQLKDSEREEKFELH